jgi:hypothetical protein
LLISKMAVGYLSGEAGKAVIVPFSSDPFKEMLTLFLLDKGLMVAKNFGSVRGKSPVLGAYRRHRPAGSRIDRTGAAHPAAVTPC